MNLPLHPDCRLLSHHEAGLAAVEKPGGILSHPNSRADHLKSILTVPYQIEDEFYKCPEGAWHLLNRLDGPTSGIILLANNPELAQVAKEAFANHQVEKEYFALVRGIPPAKSALWRDCLEVGRRGGILRTRTTKGRPNAETLMELRERGNGVPARSLISLQPKTGKTHQLRVQCAARHLPIIGDANYGDFSFNREFRKRSGQNRLFLHSHRVRMRLKYRGEDVIFNVQSPLPEVFAVALG